VRLLKKALFLALLAGGGLLYAQPDTTPLPDPNKPAKQDQTEVKIETQLSVSEMTTTSEELRKQVQLDLRHVLHLQAAARKQKDIIKLTCVNDKLIAMKPLANRFDMLYRELSGLLLDASSERFAVYQNVATGADAVNKLRKEADQCAGETETGFTAPDLPLDPTKGDPFGDDGVEPPGYASPYS
jgi:glucose/arabinose dehydrogenase